MSHQILIVDNPAGMGESMAQGIRRTCVESAWQRSFGDDAGRLHRLAANTGDLILAEMGASKSGGSDAVSREAVGVAIELQGTE